jgi:ABC-2 type transport system permease protein
VIVFATVLLGQFPGMSGWSSGEVLLIASMRLLSHGLYVLIFGRITWTTFFVQSGLIEVFHMRPMPVFRQVQLAYFPPNAIGDLGVAITLFAGALVRVDVDWTPARAGYLIAAVVGGMLMEASIFTVLGSVSIHAPTGLYWSTWLEDLLATVGNYPLAILPRFAADLLTFVLPLAFIAYFPAAVITGHQDSLGVPGLLAAAAPLIGLASFVASRQVWLFSLRRYKGVSTSW